MYVKIYTKVNVKSKEIIILGVLKKFGAGYTQVSHSEISADFDQTRYSEAKMKTPQMYLVNAYTSSQNHAPKTFYFTFKMMYIKYRKMVKNISYNNIGVISCVTYLHSNMI